MGARKLDLVDRIHHELALWCQERNAFHRREYCSEEELELLYYTKKWLAGACTDAVLAEKRAAYHPKFMPIADTQSEEEFKTWADATQLNAYLDLRQWVWMIKPNLVEYIMLRLERRLLRKKLTEIEKRFNTNPDLNTPVGL